MSQATSALPTSNKCSTSKALEAEILHNLDIPYKVVNHCKIIDQDQTKVPTIQAKNTTGRYKQINTIKMSQSPTDLNRKRKQIEIDEKVSSQSNSTRSVESIPSTSYESPSGRNPKVQCFHVPEKGDQTINKGNANETTNNNNSGLQQETLNVVGELLQHVGVCLYMIDSIRNSGKAAESIQCNNPLPSAENLELNVSIKNLTTFRELIKKPLNKMKMIFYEFTKDDTIWKKQNDNDYSPITEFSTPQINENAFNPNKQILSIPVQLPIKSERELKFFEYFVKHYSNVNCQLWNLYLQSKMEKQHDFNFFLNSNLRKVWTDELAQNCSWDKSRKLLQVSSFKIISLLKDACTVFFPSIERINMNRVIELYFTKVNK